MESLKARFRIVTPMFISGANQTEAELRVPSIKGALRFWWRALTFAQHGDDLNGLGKKEAHLFGSADEHVGQSKILLRLREHRLSFSGQRKWPQNTWEGYVGYGLIGGDQRRFIKAGSTFLLEAGISRELSKDEFTSLRDAIITLGLIGGLGGRSRKGWGSLVLKRLEGLGGDWSAPSGEVELRWALNELFKSSETQVPDYTAFSARARFELGAVQSTALDAHRFLADAYKTVLRQEGNKSHREQFGLPRKGVGKNAIGRRASSVFLHVHELSEGGAVPVVAFLPARFLDGQDRPSGDYTLVEDLLHKVARGG